MNAKASSKSRSHLKHSGLVRFMRNCMQAREDWARQYVEKMHRDMDL